jgi:ferritin
MFVQAQEEMAHGTRVFQYIAERGAAPSFAAIELPPTSFADVSELFKAVAAHEQKVTQRLNTLASQAMQEADHACYQFLMWFVNEQVEEEATAQDIVNKLKLIGDNKGALLALDNELGSRVFVNPFPAQTA